MMETTIDQSDYSQSSKTRCGKVFMACTPCRERKVSCDGTIPECTRCLTCGVSCEYAVTRKMRGPGRRKKCTKELEDRISFLEYQLQRNHQQDNYGPMNSTQPLENFEAATESTVDNGLAEGFNALEAHQTKTYPIFLHPEHITKSFQDFWRVGGEVQKSPEGFFPLVSGHLLHYALENTHAEISVVFPIFDLSTLQKLNSEQQALSNGHPAGNAARWAILCTWIAMGFHFKTAQGSEGVFAQLTKDYYYNAVLVLPDLILKPEAIERIQVILIMAVYAEIISDSRSFVMLVTNATRQIELLSPRYVNVTDSSEREDFQRLVSFVRCQESKIGEAYNLTRILDFIPI